LSSSASFLQRADVPALAQSRFRYILHRDLLPSGIHQMQNQYEISLRSAEILWEMYLLAELEDCFVEHQFTGVVL
jgi:hypothetical protein